MGASTQPSMCPRQRTLLWACTAILLQQNIAAHALRTPHSSISESPWFGTLGKSNAEGTSMPARDASRQLHQIRDPMQEEHQLQQDQQQQAPPSSNCLLQVRYGAAVGDIAHLRHVPAFVGSFDITPASPQVAVDDWLLTWRFASGENIVGAADIFGDITITDIDFLPPEPNSSTEISSKGGVGSRLDAAVDQDQPPRPQIVQSVAVRGSTPLRQPSGRNETLVAGVADESRGSTGSSAAAGLAAALAGSSVSASAFQGSEGGFFGVGGPMPGAAEGANSGNAEQENPQYVSLSFVARKGEQHQLRQDTQDRRKWDAVGVGIPEDVWLNGLYCPAYRYPHSDQQPDGTVNKQSSEGAGGSSSGSGRRARPVAKPMLASGWPETLRVEYMPIQYQDNSKTVPGGSELFSSSFTQMYIRLLNVGSNTSINLEEVQLQYWFDASLEADAISSVEEESSAAAGLSSLASSQFKMYCSDVNDEIPGGCDAVQGSFSAGLVGVRRARFILNLTFKPGTGALVPLGQTEPPFLNNNTPSSDVLSADANSANSSGVRNVTSLQAIISIEPRRYLTQLDAREDYSFMPTPLRSDEEQAESKILLRVPEPNPYIPAFVGGELAWGTPPRAGPFRQNNSSGIQDASFQPRLPEGHPGKDLPPGAFCHETADGSQVVCGVSVVYCCTLPPASMSNFTASESLSAIITHPPPDWRDQWQQRHEAFVSAADGHGQDGDGGDGDSGGENRGAEDQGSSGNGMGSNTRGGNEGGGGVLEGGSIAGIVVGVVAGSALLTLCVVGFVAHHRSRQIQHSDSSKQPSNQDALRPASSSGLDEHHACSTAPDGQGCRTVGRDLELGGGESGGGGGGGWPWATCRRGSTGCRSGLSQLWPGGSGQLLRPEATVSEVGEANGDGVPFQLDSTQAAGAGGGALTRHSSLASSAVGGCTHGMQHGIHPRQTQLSCHDSLTSHRPTRHDSLASSGAAGILTHGRQFSGIDHSSRQGSGIMSQLQPGSHNHNGIDHSSRQGSGIMSQLQHGSYNHNGISNIGSIGSKHSNGRISSGLSHHATNHTNTSSHASSSLLAALFCGGSSGSPSMGRLLGAKSPVPCSKGSASNEDTDRGCTAGPDWRHTFAGLLGGCGLGSRRGGPSLMLSNGGGSGELSGQRGPYLTSSAALESAPSSPTPATGSISNAPSSAAAPASRGRGRHGRGRPGVCSRKKSRQQQSGTAILSHGRNNTRDSNNSSKGGRVACGGLSSSGANAPAARGAGVGSAELKRGEDSRAGATAFLYQFTREDEDWLVRAPQLSVWDEKYPTMPAAVGDDGFDGFGDSSGCGMWGIEQQPAVMGPVCYLPTADQASFLPRRMTSGMLDSAEVESQLLLEDNLLPPVDPAISPGLPRMAGAPTTGQVEQPQQVNGQVAGADTAALAVSRQGSLVQMAMPAGSGSYPHTTTDDDDVRSRIIRRKCMTWAGRLGIDGDEQTASLVDLPHGVVANLMPPPRRYMLVSHASGSPCIPPAVPPSPSSPVLLPSGGSCASQLASRHCYYYQRTPQHVPPVDLHIDFDKEVAPTLGRLIGVGGFGRVYAAQWRGQNVAVKVLTCDDAKHYQALLKEVQLCARFRACPYIVRLLGACMGPRCKRTPSKASTAASTAGTAAPPAVLHSVRKSSTAHHTYSSTDTGTGIMLEAGTDVKPGGGADIGSAVQQPESRAEQTGAGCSSKDGLSHSGASHAGTPPHLGTAQAGFVGPPLSPQLEVNRSLFATGAMASTEGHEAMAQAPAACQPHGGHHHHYHHHHHRRRRRHRHCLPPPALHRLQRRQKHHKAQKQQMGLQQQQQQQQQQQHTGLQEPDQELQPSEEIHLQLLHKLHQPFLLNASASSTCSTPDAMIQAPPAFQDPPYPRRSCSFAALQEFNSLNTPSTAQRIPYPSTLAHEQGRKASAEEGEHSACSSHMFQSAAGSSVFGSCSNSRDLSSWQGSTCFESKHCTHEGRRKGLGDVLYQASSASPSQLPTTPLSSPMPAVSPKSLFARSSLGRGSGSRGHSSYQSWDSSSCSPEQGNLSVANCMPQSGNSPHAPAAGGYHGDLHQHQSGVLAATAAAATASPLQMGSLTLGRGSPQPGPISLSAAPEGQSLLISGPIGEGATGLEAQGALVPAKAAVTSAVPQASASAEGVVAAAQHSVQPSVECNEEVQQHCKQQQQQQQQQRDCHRNEEAQSAVPGRQGTTACAAPVLQPADSQACGCASSDAEWEKQREEEEMDSVDAGAAVQQREGPRQVSLIMELADYSLAERIHVCKTQPPSARESPQGGPMSMRELLQVSYDVAAGLAALHASGVIHRDLKPQNVLLVKERGKLCDFGISRLKDPYRSCVSVTQQGGTPHYMAPELFNGSRVDEKCDIYSLGCIIYECVTGRAPWSELNAPPPKPPRPPTCAENSSSSNSGRGSNEGPQQKPKHEAPDRDAGSSSSRSSNKGGEEGGDDGGTEGAVGGGGAVMPQGGMGALFQIILAVAINRRRPTIPDHCPPGVRALITACWRDDPRQRPPARVLMARLEELQRREAERRAIAAAAAKAKRTTSANSGNSSRRRRI